MDKGDGNCMGNGNNIDTDQQDALGNPKPLQQNVTARMTVSRSGTHYNMEHKYRGQALIFNHETFKVHGLRPRSGTQVDCQNISSRLKLMGFEVTVCSDYEYKDIQSAVTEAAYADHSDCDCFVMMVLSHGEMGILYAKDTPYKPELLWSPFAADRCPSLAGKPKLFFIQACQGDKLDGGVTMSRTETDGHPSDSYRIPSQADFLIAYSTVPGYYSWRNTTRGSWFMQALVEELEENGYNYDLLTLLTFVNRRVAIDYESNTPDIPTMHRQKQIPCITSMLTRLLVFNRKGLEQHADDCGTRDGAKTKGKAKSMFGSLFGASKPHTNQANNII